LIFGEIEHDHSERVFVVLTLKLPTKNANPVHIYHFPYSLSIVYAKKESKEKRTLE